MAAAEQMLSPTEFLEWETSQTERFEYIAGRIYAMAGGSFAHIKLVTRLIGFYLSRLSPPCEIYTEGLKVQIGAGFLYPDALILCGAPVFYDGREDTIVNPTVVFEVLSPSTEAFDRGEKFRRYRSLDGLETIVFVAQDQPLVEVWTRAGDAWQVETVDALEQSFSLNRGDAPIPLSALYEGLSVGV